MRIDIVDEDGKGKVIAIRVTFDGVEEVLFDSAEGELIVAGSLGRVILVGPGLKSVLQKIIRAVFIPEVEEKVKPLQWKL